MDSESAYACDSLNADTGRVQADRGRFKGDYSCADEDPETCDRSTLISMLEEAKRREEELLEDNYGLKYRNVMLSLELLELKSG